MTTGASCPEVMVLKLYSLQYFALCENAFSWVPAKGAQGGSDNDPVGMGMYACMYVCAYMSMCAWPPCLLVPPGPGGSQHQLCVNS